MTKTEHKTVERTCASATCGRTFDAATTYGGRPARPVRLYCRPRCAADARNRIRRLQSAYDRQYEALIEMHELEQAGQVSLVEEPLPAVPPRPERSAS